MVNVKPFCGVVCNPTMVSELPSRPYDTITRKQAKELSNQHKHSFYRVIRPEIDLPTTVDEHDPQVYKLARTNLEEFIKKGYLLRDSDKCFYAYEIQYENYKSLGLFLMARIQDYEDGRIKKHELTRKDKEMDRTILIDIQNANAEPILLTYPKVDTIEQCLQKVIGGEPLLETQFEDDNSHHKIWKLNKAETEFIQSQMSDVDNFYIADGHHRMAASTNVALKRREDAIQNGIQISGEESYEYILAFAVSFPNLNIMPYNRLIKSLKNKNENEILEQISEVFDVRIIENENEIDPQLKGQYSMRLANQWWQLIPKQHHLQNLLGINPTCDQKLDVSILQALCITPILGIQDIRTDKNIDFLGGIEGAKGLQYKMENEDYAISFACYPVQIEEIVEISDKNKIMLPKATWIVPKPRSGLVLRLF